MEEKTIAELEEMEKEKTFAERLVAYRRSHYLTQKQMAELLGLSRNHIGVLERGLKMPRATTMAKFVDLSGKRELRRIGDSKPLTESELETFKAIWDGMCKLSALQRAQILSVFKTILLWFR